MYTPHKKYFVYPDVDRHGNMYTGTVSEEINYNLPESYIVVELCNQCKDKYWRATIGQFLQQNKLIGIGMKSDYTIVEADYKDINDEICWNAPRWIIKPKNLWREVNEETFNSLIVRVRKYWSSRK